MSQQNGNQQPDGRHAYPLIENAAESLHAASGRAVSDLDLNAVATGDLSAADLQIGAETLHAQAEIARNAGYRELAENLTRAAELTAVPNDELLRMYELLRPGRATFVELTELAQQLADDYQATVTARFVREAADVYRSRQLLRRE